MLERNQSISSETTDQKKSQITWWVTAAVTTMNSDHGESGFQQIQVIYWQKAEQNSDRSQKGGLFVFSFLES